MRRKQLMLPVFYIVAIVSCVHLYRISFAQDSSKSLPIDSFRILPPPQVKKPLNSDWQRYYAHYRKVAGRALTSDELRSLTRARQQYYREVSKALGLTIPQLVSKEKELAAREKDSLALKKEPVPVGKESLNPPTVPAVDPTKLGEVKKD